MKGKLKCVVALLLCMTMAFGTNLSTLADTNTAVPQTVQVQETEQNAQEGEATQAAGEQQQTQETKETSSGETQTQQETQAEETQGGQTAQAEEEKTVQEEEKTEQETAQTPEGQGETTAQTGEKGSAEVKEETVETQVTTEMEKVIEVEDEEEETQDTPDINQMSAKEAYEYLSRIENDTEYYKVWDSLNDTKEKELLDYINEVTAGEEITYSPGTSAVNFALAAPLVVEKAIDAKTARSIILNSEEKNGSFNTSDKTTPDDGVVLSKKLVTDGDGSPYLQLESFVTGSVTAVDKRVPVDIVLVLDQSGSMAYDFDGTVYRRQNYTNGDAERYQDNLYVYADGKYRKVQVEENGTTSEENYSLVYGNHPRYWKLEENTGYYVQTEDGIYHQIYVEQIQNVYNSYYLDDNNNKVTLENNKNGSDKLLYRKNIYQKETTTTYKYVYSYQAEDGSRKKIEESEGANNYPSTELYRRVTNNGTRLDALQNAVTSFVNSVEQDAEENSVDHRIAIVGFSSANDYWRNYNNTEILTGCSIEQGQYYGDNPDDSSYFPTGYAQNGVQHSSSEYSTRTHSALQNVSTSTGKTSVQNAINALTAYGGTQTDEGIEMAEDILATQSAQYGDAYADGSRKKVVIVFTDGEPTGGSSSWNSTAAENAIKNAKDLKDNQTTVYSVGIFDDADGTISSSSGKPNSPSHWGQTNNDANKFMHLISSNYPSAENMKTEIDSIVELTKDEEGNYRSYYLSADDADGLNNVFQSISDEIGGATIDLNETTVLYDAISDSFALPEGVKIEDIKVFTSDCIEVRTNGDNKEYVFDSGLDPVNANILVDEASNSVKVWGFNYSQNYVGKKDDRAVGKKLVVQIPIDLSTKYTFGGNGIPTNKNTSGLYDATGTTCYGNLEIPMVNIPIDYKIAAVDQTIYRTNQADLSKLLTYVENYRPNGINNKYVTIEYQLKEGDTVLGTYKIGSGATEGQWTWKENAQNPALDQCTEYELSCTVTPTIEKPDGSINYHEEAKTETIGPEKPYVHVLVPKIELKDQQIFLGETIDVNSSILSLEDQKWIDLKGHATSNLIGNKPSVTITPELVEGTSIKNGVDSYQPDQDSNFKVDVQINDKSNLQRGRDYQVIPVEPIDDENCWKPIEQPEDHDFTIHVVAGEIDITKVLEDVENRNPDLEGDPIFTFQISDDNGNTWYRAVRIKESQESAQAEVLSGLPKGVYTITELDTIRYRNTDILAEGSTCPTKKEDNSIIAYIGYSGQNTPTTNVANRKAIIKFENTRNDSSKLTDSDIRLNRFTKSGDTWDYEEIEIPQNPNQNN